MKILLATSAAIPSGGGIASYNQELLQLLGKDNEFHLLTSADEHNVEGYLSTECVYRININDYNIARLVIDKINSKQFDLIINSDSELVSISAPFLKAPIITVAHFVNGILADRAGINSEYVNTIISLSYYGKAYLEKKFGITDASKVKVVYNFVRKKCFESGKENNRKLVIVYPGGTSIKKSLDVVMDVAYRLKRTKLDFIFYWLGNTILPSANFSIFGVKDLRQMLHDDPRFVITGFVPREQSESIISSANVFLLPSRGEGCPMTLLEAMRAGCIPIVSDAKHGSRELVEKSNFGFVIKQGDSKAICSLINDIICNHDRYREYYLGTKQFSDDELSPQKWGDQMSVIIKQAVDSTRTTEIFSEFSYKTSLLKYKRLLKQDRRIAKLNSFINRVKMDWLFLKWKGWK